MQESAVKFYPIAPMFGSSASVHPQGPFLELMSVMFQPNMGAMSCWRSTALLLFIGSAAVICSFALVSEGEDNLCEARGSDVDLRCAASSGREGDAGSAVQVSFKHSERIPRREAALAPEIAHGQPAWRPKPKPKPKPAPAWRAKRSADRRCQGDKVDVTIELSVGHGGGDLGAPLHLSFHRGHCTESVASVSAGDASDVRVIHTAMLKWVLAKPGYLSIQLVSPTGQYEQRVNVSGRDLWIRSVALHAVGHPHFSFHYSGWAGSLEALAILPVRHGGLISVADHDQEGVDIQLWIGKALYQWTNWASLHLPLNCWTPRHSFINFFKFLGTNGGTSWNIVSNGITAPETDVYEDVQEPSAMPEIVEQALERFREVFSHQILPINEIIPSARDLQVGLLQLAMGNYHVGPLNETVVAIADYMEDVFGDEDAKLGFIGVEERWKALWVCLRAADVPHANASVLIEGVHRKGPIGALPVPGVKDMPSDVPGAVPTDSRWKEDWFLGQQMLQGVAPTLLKLVEGALPKHLAVTDETLGVKKEGKGLLGGLTIAQAIAKKLLFIVDLDVLDGITWFQGGSLVGLPEGSLHLPPRYACAAVGLFFLDKDRQSLLPVALQLGQDPTSSPVYTPHDPLPEWTVAKMFFQCSVAQMHQLDVHALRTHLLSEPWEIALMRNLPSTHPVHRLMKPHMRHTLQINMMARASLIAPGMVFDSIIATGASKEQWERSPLLSNASNASWESVGYVDLIQRSYARWSPEDNHFRKAVHKRGVSIEDLPIDYPYRDDGGLVWDALHEFVCNMLELSYPDDEAVNADSFLHHFAEDISFALQNRQGYNGKTGSRFPTQAFSTRSGLCETISSALWGSGYQHSGVNYGQYDSYGYVPNMPLSMMKPVPARGEGPKTMDEVVDYLPPFFMAALQMDITYVLSTYYSDQVYLGQVERTYGAWYVGKLERDILTRYQEKLDNIEQIVTERNKIRKVYYPMYLPSKCPISITV